MKTNVALIVSCAAIGYALLFCGIATAETNVWSRFPTNVALGMSLGTVQTNRPSVVQVPAGFGACSTNQTTMYETVPDADPPEGYGYTFKDSLLRGMTSSRCAAESTNDLSAEITAGGFSNRTSHSCLRLGDGLQLETISVDLWHTASNDLDLCSLALTNETTVVLFDPDYLSISNFFLSAQNQSNITEALGAFTNKFSQ